MSSTQDFSYLFIFRKKANLHENELYDKKKKKSRPDQLFIIGLSLSSMCYKIILLLDYALTSYLITRRKNLVQAAKKYHLNT